MIKHNRKVNEKKKNRRNNTRRLLYDWIGNEVVSAEANGIAVNVNGVPYCSKNLRELYYMLEDGVYMKDYLWDETGKIIQINFDIIKV